MRLAFFLILAMASAAYADDPFACVDPDVTAAFLGDSYRGRGEYSTKIPGGFVDLNLPAGFSHVGSQTFDAMSTVVYEADMEKNRAFTAALDAMTDKGWTEAHRQRLGVMGGFQSRSRATAATVLCNDDFSRALSLSAAEKSGQTFVSYSEHSDAQSCRVKEAAVFRHDPVEAMRLVPRLQLPEGARTTNTGMGGDGHQANSRVDVFGTTSRADLSNFLEGQIRDQGWEFQTSWSSHHSSGSIWALETPEEGLVVGTLHLMDSGDEPIRVRFSVTVADPSKGKDYGSWSGSSH